MITHHFDVEPKQPCQLPSVQLLHASIHHGSPTARCDLHSHIFTELLYIPLSLECGVFPARKERTVAHDHPSL